MESRVGRLALSKSPQTDSSLSRPEEHPPNPNAQSTSIGLQAQMAGRRLRDGYGFGPEYESGRHGKTPYRLFLQGLGAGGSERIVSLLCNHFAAQGWTVTLFAFEDRDTTPYYPHHPRSEEHTSELQSLMRNSSGVFCLKKKK